MPTTIVIGMGISAVAYLRSIDRPLGRTYAMGGPDLWNRLDRHHAMGQPRQLLTGNLLGNRPTDRNFSRSPTPGTFLSAGIFADAMVSHLAETGTLTMPGTLVTSITKPGGMYTVGFRSDGRDHEIQCDNVIIATGPGEERPLTSADNRELEINVSRSGGRIVHGNDFMSPTWSMPGGRSREGATVIVYGGSATAAWVVELAEMRRMNVVLWFTRVGNGGDAWNPTVRFEQAFPAGGRNTEVQRDFEDRRKVLKLMNVQNSGSTNALLLTFENQQGAEETLPADLLVYALGAEHTVTAGVGRMLKSPLRDAMVPFYDRNYALSGTPSILAVGTPDGSLMIVGSAMNSVAGFGRQAGMMQYRDPQRALRDLQPYSRIADSLPSAARPAEGIAMVMAGVEALNSYMPVTPGRRRVTYTTPRGRNRVRIVEFEWDINFNTSNRTQLAAYIAQTTDLSPLAANIAVSLLVRLRTMRVNALGLGVDQVNTIVQSAERYAAEIVRLNPDLEVKRRYWEGVLGIDGHLDVMVKHFIENAGWREYWRVHGINCDVPVG